jgi:hypothetical protein
MNKRLCIFIALTLITIGCSKQSPSKSSTATYTAGNETELRDGAMRVNQLKQELLDRRFRVTSTTASESMDRFTLRGDYGALKDAEELLKVKDADKDALEAKAQALMTAPVWSVA